MKDKTLIVASYIVVAMLSSICTMILFNPQPETTKLDVLEALIEERYIGEVDMEAAMDAAANAMVESLPDRWSYYISADEYQSYVEQMRNAYVGIGVAMEPTADGKGVKILRVIPDGPAEAAGICAGDVLTHVEGTSLAELGMAGVRNIIRGEEGEKVKLTLMRGNESLELLVSLGTIKTKVAKGQMLQGKIGYVQIMDFDDRCMQETKDEIEKLQAEGATALILDVRNNSGGYKRELVPLLDYLLPEGIIFRSENYAGSVSEEFSDANYLDMPMAVLVNGNTYSAAEFFAVALSEFDAAVIVGEKTSGKGYFQQTYTLSDGSAVALSVGKYYTPSGVSLEEVGITPDVQCPLDEETAYLLLAGLLPVEEDPQIQAAVNVLLGK